MEARIAEQTRSFKYTLHLTTSNYRRLQLHAPDSTPLTPMTPQVFHLFSSLPAELREQIWLLTFPSARLLEVYTETDRCQTGHCRGSCEFARVGQFFAANPHDPSFLHVCREAREIGLKQFKYCFRTYPPPEAIVESPLTRASGRGNDERDVSTQDLRKVVYPGVLFQPSKDTIWLRAESRAVSSQTFIDAKWDEIDVSAIQSLALDDWEHGLGTGFARQDWIYPPLFIGPNSPMTGLREIIMMRVWQYTGPLKIVVPNEKVEDEKWRAWMRGCLRHLGYPFVDNVRIEMIRKSLLWNRVGVTGSGQSKLKWERADRPHWIAYPISKEARKAAFERHEKAFELVATLQ